MKNNNAASILVAIADLDDSALPLLAKAGALARQRGAALDLLYVIALPYGPAGPQASVKAALRAAVEQAETALAKLARTPRLRGLRVRRLVRWDYPAADAIVRVVLQRRPALVLAQSQRRSRWSRTVLTNTDWELIRNCPSPLWLSKRAQVAARPNVVAALDPFHTHAKPAALDDAILRAAVEAAGSPRRVFVFHAYPIPRPLAADGGLAPYWAVLSTEELTKSVQRARKALERAARRHEIPLDNVHCEEGDAVTRLPQFAQRRKADLVVMGAVSRTGLKRLFIGNTAERVLDALSCDVLVIKPRGFRTMVTRKPVKLAPYPPYPA